MNRQEALKFIQQIKSSDKKKFTQSIDFVINLQDLDFKKQEHNVDFFATLHHTRGVPVRICGFVGPELKEQSKKVFDQTVTLEEFDQYQKSKKLTKKLAKANDFFVAQAHLMAQMATTFGRVLGPRNKMPNPKAGCVVPNNAQLAPIKERLQKLVRISTKQRTTIHLMVGKEDMPDQELADNLFDMYTQLINHLPAEKNNIKSMFLKLTMGKAHKIYPA